MKHMSLVVGVAMVSALMATGCGEETTPGGTGAGITCQVGETLREDSQGVKYCQPASGDASIGGNDSGTTGQADGTTGQDTGGTTGTDTGGTTGTDTGGGTTDAGGPTDPWAQCPPVKGKGLEHGKKCSKHSDCLYGYCMKGGHLTGYDDSISYCTKNNGCTGGGSAQTAPCAPDDGAPSGVTYKSAFEKSKSGGNDKRTSKSPYKVCARVCKTDSECASWNSEMPDCILSSTKYVSAGTQGVCGKNPLK
ncbi:MAG: hypothetical protein KC502_07955 [Myxococcales bacterium]|nr:hypothetical protein [Myxococcales bacterium]